VTRSDQAPLQVLSNPTEYLIVGLRFNQRPNNVEQYTIVYYLSNAGFHNTWPFKEVLTISEISQYRPQFLSYVDFNYKFKKLFQF
jgi:hypothetical protein